MLYRQAPIETPTHYQLSHVRESWILANVLIVGSFIFFLSLSCLFQCVDLRFHKQQAHCGRGQGEKAGTQGVSSGPQ